MKQRDLPIIQFKISIRNFVLNKKKPSIDGFHFSVGMTGFEPAAPTSLTWCANRTALHPELFNEILSKSVANISFILYFLELFFKFQSF